MLVGRTRRNGHRCRGCGEAHRREGGSRGAGTRRTGLQPGEVERPRFARKVRQAPDPVPLSPDVVRYVEACASILWKPAGRPVLDYLVSERGLEPEVLRLNRVGADPGPDVLHQARELPHGGVGAVFPVLDRTGEVAYCQTGDTWRRARDRREFATTPPAAFAKPAGRLGSTERLTSDAGARV